MSSSVSFQAPRKLRVFAFDPSTGNQFINRRTREVVLSIPWELDPVQRDQAFIGPCGEYLEVIDYDPSSGVFYDPVNLNDAKLLFSDGLSPSAENPKFHQQMVYAVAMDTIATFEEALGRFVIWAPRSYYDVGRGEERYVKTLRIYPHALREANAFYDPQKKALLFGYFTADQSSTSAPSGTTVFTCLSHDVVVHETCHAILDGIHPRFVENSNRDMLALHEAFADIVAIFQHFSHPSVLEDQIGRTRGDLESQNLLGALAQEFGEAMGRGGALRDALGKVVEGKWRPRDPDNAALNSLRGPHARGAVLVAAVFRTFLTIYKERVADLFRIGSQGSGILRAGQIDPDLVKRLATEAAKSARHILRMCIRAMDYIPPVNVEFGDFLRAIITADHDLFPEDDYGYRVAVIEAFTAWGIYPTGMASVTEASLLWPSLREAAADNGKYEIIDSFEAKFGALVSRPQSIFDTVREELNQYDEGGQELIERLERKRRKINDLIEKSFEKAVHRSSNQRPVQSDLSKSDILSRNLLAQEYENGREAAFAVREYYAELFWGMFNSLDLSQDDDLMCIIGVNLVDGAPRTISRSPITGRPTIEINSVRMATRIGKRGVRESEYVVEIVQSRDGFLDPSVQKTADESAEDTPDYWVPVPNFRYRSGSTLLIDSKSFEIRRVIRTRYGAENSDGLDAQRRHLMRIARDAPNAFDAPKNKVSGNAFSALHRNTRDGAF